MNKEVEKHRIQQERVKLEKNKLKILTMIILIFTFWVCFLIIETNNLNKRIDDLEKQSEEVHEYILNRIGG